MMTREWLNQLSSRLSVGRMKELDGQGLGHVEWPMGVWFHSKMTRFESRAQPNIRLPRVWAPLLSHQTQGNHDRKHF